MIRRVLNILSRMKPGVYLLLTASALLFAGAIIVDFHSDDFRILNFTLLCKWLALYQDRPVLYVWMVLLFTVLSLLSLNTCLCTWKYLKNTTQSGITMKKAGIVLFHVSFLVFLSGHLFYECTGSSESLVLEKGSVSQLSGAELFLEPVMLQRINRDLAGKKIRMGTQTSIIIKDSTGEITRIYPESMNPDFSMGYSFHVSMNERGLSAEQVRVIIRKAPALYLFIAGAAGIIIGLLFLMLGTGFFRSGLSGRNVLSMNGKPELYID